ncbi:YraN family protein [Pseudaquidulcibacter saccharophilus]|uniref:YraN family protein n=1 Tax=Pseudaquidulcibacter saccharophilus TaxID=2831900 RepID=UPI001EFF0A29|nr:YraN family protein [Pseudaquidulcibacter saccharophilus]
MSEKRQKSEFYGRLAEFAAILLLTLKFYLVLRTRYRNNYGEIDIIALRGKKLVFVEVKLRKATESAQFSISHRQMERIKNAAIGFCKSRKWAGQKQWRYDVIACAPWKLPKHIKNAF